MFNPPTVSYRNIRTSIKRIEFTRKTAFSHINARTEQRAESLKLFRFIQLRTILKYRTMTVYIRPSVSLVAKTVFFRLPVPVLKMPNVIRPNLRTRNTVAQDFNQQQIIRTDFLLQTIVLDCRHLTGGSGKQYTRLVFKFFFDIRETFRNITLYIFRSLLFQAAVRIRRGTVCNRQVLLISCPIGDTPPV